jgi:hypothetical protein
LKLLKIGALVRTTVRRVWISLSESCPYPSDWWSDGRSPFPEYVSCLLMKNTGYAEEAQWRKGVQAGKKDHVLFWKLDEEYGFKLFARFFALVRADGIELGRIGAPWPRPDKLRSAYTIAYLSLAAGRNLAGMIGEYGVGTKPADWEQRHSQIKFEAYRVLPKEVDEILAAREKAFGRSANRQKAPLLKRHYRTGDYRRVLEES